MCDRPEILLQLMRHNQVFDVAAKQIVCLLEDNALEREEQTWSYAYMYNVSVNNVIHYDHSLGVQQ